LTCPNCNTIIPDNNIYCNNCGIKLNPSEIDNWVNVNIDLDGLIVNANQLTWGKCKILGVEAYKNGNFYEAIEYFGEAFKFEIEDAKEISNIYNELGICYGQIEDYKKSLIYIDLAISANAENFIAIENRIGVKMKLGNEKGAIVDISILFENGKMVPKMWHTLGIALENIKQYENARQAYECAINEGYLLAAKDLEDILIKIDKL